jgi:hypothetical protein
MRKTTWINRDKPLANSSIKEAPRIRIWKRPPREEADHLA